MADEMLDAVATTSREFEIDQSIEIMIGQILEGAGELSPNEEKEIHRLVMDRIRLLMPTFAMPVWLAVGENGDSDRVKAA